MNINNKILTPKHPALISIRLSLVLAIIGGFLDAYTFIDRGKVFANAQTGNIVLFGINIADGKVNKALLYLLPILAFILGVLVSHYIKNSFMNNAEKIILTLEIIILLVISIVPLKLPDTLVNVIISFIASVQVSTFRKLVDYPYCSTMCTGNLRSASDALFSYLRDKDKSELKKLTAYILIIIFFIIGAILSAFFTIKYGVKSLLICVILLFISLGLLHFDIKIR